jgi:hypothetical protein
VVAVGNFEVITADKFNKNKIVLLEKIQWIDNHLKMAEMILMREIFVYDLVFGRI